MAPLLAKPLNVDSRICSWMGLPSPTFHVAEDQKLQPVFPTSSVINNRVLIWKDPISRLNSDVVVNCANETFNDTNDLSLHIHKMAGKSVTKECSTLEPCRTGEVRCTTAGKLPAKYIMHAVAPRYNLKYANAANSALFGCVRCSLQMAKVQGMDSIGVPLLHLYRPEYPPEEGAHIIFRTVRRFLEQHLDYELKVIFCIPDSRFSFFEPLLSMYFPRTPDEEQFSVMRLPKDVGDANGEPVFVNRKIRIDQTPVKIDHETRMELGDNYRAFSEFSSMSENHDYRRITEIKSRQRKEEKNVKSSHDNIVQYRKLLRYSRIHDLTQFKEANIIYRVGFDSNGRVVLGIIGKSIPETFRDPDLFVTFLVGYLDPIVYKNYSVVYFHTRTSGNEDLSWCEKLLNVVDKRYVQNLHQVYIVHPSLWMKISTWFTSSFSMTALKKKITHVDSLRELYQTIGAPKLDLPPFVVDYDSCSNGDYPVSLCS